MILREKKKKKKKKNFPHSRLSSLPAFRFPPALVQSLSRVSRVFPIPSSLLSASGFSLLFYPQGASSANRHSAATVASISVRLRFYFFSFLLPTDLSSHSFFSYPIWLHPDGQQGYFVQATTVHRLQ
jgi:hypothetical protein